ncbi:transglutaminase family protein [Falsirhodobacter xinxiangensis]|uniref:transglutaminase family protein n=1 Tax=Falsirhodobacter xinxiangensis TaxID=2530049 RepID=UPI0010AADC10|nr:transglutaminase family protein [Rhodobacter xinxiangensis]
MPTLNIVHRTTYRYRAPVQLLPHRLMLRPRESYELKLLSHQVECSPAAKLTWSSDVFGNGLATARFQEQTDLLVIESHTQVKSGAPAWPVFDIDASAISYPFSYADDIWTDLGSFTIRQYAPKDATVEPWARSFIAFPQTDTLSLLKDLNLGVHREIRYESREDEGTQSPEQTLDVAAGSCRDLAVLLADAARALGFGARLVSGYLWPDSLEIKGAGSTHAWVEIFLPGPGWIAFDPTNGTMGAANLIPVAVARKITQAVPVSGSFKGPAGAFERMEVEVDVRSLDLSPTADRTVEIYKSANGDRWLLIQNGDRSVVHHEPNSSSGGQASETDLHSFLTSQGQTPQGESLRRMIEAGGKVPS